MTLSLAWSNLSLKENNCLLRIKKSTYVSYTHSYVFDTFLKLFNELYFKGCCLK